MQNSLAYGTYELLPRRDRAQYARLVWSEPIPILAERNSS